MLLLLSCHVMVTTAKKKGGKVPSHRMMENKGAELLN